MRKETTKAKRIMIDDLQKKQLIQLDLKKANHPLQKKLLTEANSE